MKIWLTFRLLIATFFLHTSVQCTVDLVIFSFNRPLQLYALLESIEKYVEGIASTHIIYRANTKSFVDAYKTVQEHFYKNTLYYQQGENPYNDFKPLTMKAAFTSENPYIIFAVDDIVVTQPINLVHCAQLLEQSQAYGFYLRLGKNIRSCYALHDYPTPHPALKEIGSDAFLFSFKEGQGDWAYPHTVDMTLYRKRDIKLFFDSMNFHSPNTLEGNWASYDPKNENGICFDRSAIVNIPLNIVNEDWKNRAENGYSAEEMLSFFKQGLKIDINPLGEIMNESPHMAYSFIFADR